jgi:hypothetical protein
MRTRTAAALAPRRVRNSRASRFAEFLDGRLARLDQQLAVAVAPQVETQEVEPLGEVHDPGLGLVEHKAPRCQPRGQPRLDLLGLLPGGTAGDQVIGVPGHRRAAGYHIVGVDTASIADPGGLLQPM